MIRSTDLKLMLDYLVAKLSLFSTFCDLNLILKSYFIKVLKEQMSRGSIKETDL